MSPPRRPVSIVCVFNNAEMLRECLQRSIEALRDEAPDTEFLPIDNTSGAFPTAGAALNHGASIARQDFVVFCHQDVYLHSLTALELSAGLLAEHNDIGMIGAVGISSDGRVRGRVRDRVVLLGEALTEPTDVDSLDEVLFIIPRALITRLPLATEADLAWHAYAVEYGLRLRAEGLRVTAGDIPLTHNSLSINLDRLDVAHRTVGQKYPQLLPVQTTCGLIRPPRRENRAAALARPHRWRYRWLRESMATRSVRRQVRPDPFVLGDIRMDIDQVLAEVEPITIVNYAGEAGFADEGQSCTTMTRMGRRISVRSVRTADALQTILAERGDSESLLITNLDGEILRSIAAGLGAGERVFGLHGEMWALFGPAATARPPQWRSKRARPLGASKLPG